MAALKGGYNAWKADRPVEPNGTGSPPAGGHTDGAPAPLPEAVTRH